MPRHARRSLHPGDLRLLHDLAVLRLVIDTERPPARERLEGLLGPELLRAVECSLAEPTARAA